MKTGALKTFFGILLLIIVGESAVLLFGPFGMESGSLSMMDFLFLTLIVGHAAWWAASFRKRRKNLFRTLFRAPELLFSFTLMLFLFSFIFASNANMDYVQRFAASSGNFRLAPDSTVERLNSLLRYLPFLLYQFFVIIFARIRYRNLFNRSAGGSSFFIRWGLPAALVSAFLYAVSLPSFVRLDGLAPLAWVCLIPLFLTLREGPRWWRVFYGVTFGIIQTMLCNYWLGTFSLISLQFITLIYLIFYFLFMAVLVHITENTGRWSSLIIPAAWIGFDFLRSQGFLGYPWALLGVSQYSFIPMIQMASVTGVWGISFVLYAFNVHFADCIRYFIYHTEKIRAVKLLKSSAPYAAGIALILIGGAVHLTMIREKEAEAPSPTARVALIQQNTDPRKDDYESGFTALKKLTDAALVHEPDLIAWSETAFVLNIRRWGALDPSAGRFPKLVHQFLEYQKSTGTWLLTGNDDYFIDEDEEGNEQRRDYNASILFSPEGERVETYHKIHLVPFTEYFPFREQLPGLYQFLLDWDVNLWSPGTETVVFQHPLFTFSTPICFEDSFPGDIRRFVLAGADVILNISNDFWSLTNVEAKQHYVNSLFRAVENRKTLLRSTASGVTAHVTPEGRLVERLPYYEEGYLIAEIPLETGRTSIYTRFGNWFVYLCGLIAAGAVIFQVLRLNSGTRR